MLNLLGLLLPPVIDYINRKFATSSDTRLLVSVIVCAVVGVVVNFISMNGFTGYAGMSMLDIADGVATSIMAVFGLAQLSFKVAWEKTDTHDETKRLTGGDN